MAKRINGPTLPPQTKIDVQAFSRALDDTTATYKFLWLLAILKIVESKNETVIKFRDISREMVNLAIPPVYEFKLHFGGSDQTKGSDRTKQYLNRIFLDGAPKREANNAASVSFSTKEEERFDRERRDMERYVPYRLLTPFFESDLRGLKDHDKNPEIIKRAAKTFRSKSPPLYRFISDGDNSAIEIHPSWRDYWLSNMAIVRGWAMWNWATFLQDRNPSIPGIINKIQHDSPERLMGAQRDFWKEVIKHKNGHTICIYSENKISFAQCDIDHYIPWSFIGHSHLWNLAPVAKEANRSKSDRLPADNYLQALVNAQHEALTIRERRFPRKFGKLIDPYYNDLGLSASELMDETKLFAAYKKLMKPTIAMAQNNQFSPGWRWKNK